MQFNDEINVKEIEPNRAAITKKLDEFLAALAVEMGCGIPSTEPSVSVAEEISDDEKIFEMFKASENRKKKLAMPDTMGECYHGNRCCRINYKNADIECMDDQLKGYWTKMREIETETVNKKATIQQAKQAQGLKKKFTKKAFKSLYKSTGAQIIAARNEEVCYFKVHNRT